MNFINLNVVQADGSLVGLTFSTTLLNSALFLSIANGTQISFPNGLPTLVVTETADAIIALLNGSIVKVASTGSAVESPVV